MFLPLAEHGIRASYVKHGCRCEVCRAWNAAQSDAYTVKNRERRKASNRASQQRMREKRRIRHHEAYDPFKSKAREIAKKAVRDGLLVRGSSEINEDCYGSVEGHHDDYTKPLEVRWLCKRHHRIYHARNP